jgi:hypothetical protein
MRCADGVDIMAFHRQQILLQELKWYGPAVFGVVLVAVDTSKHDSLAIDFDEAILHLNLTETNTLSDILLGAERDNKVV